MSGSEPRGWRQWVENPWLNLIAGLLAVFFAGAEILRGFQNDVETLELGSHHAVALLGLMHALKALPDAVDGLERLAAHSSSRKN